MKSTGEIIFLDGGGEGIRRARKSDRELERKNQTKKKIKIYF